MAKDLLKEEALKFHSEGRPGKFEIKATKPLSTQKELSLAYSPGVAAPCLEIAKDPLTVYDYTTKGNTVAIISNGTAVLGLGNIGALASKPVMEGKAVLFKRFADIDGIDLEIGTEDVEEFINAVKYLGPTFGGINLEDIKSPECFVIENRLKEIMDIPVFHDDQHGTAIAVAAGLINALHITKKKIEDVKIVSNGAGAASIACTNLILKMGANPKNILMLDRDGVIYKGREKLMNEWKEKFAIETEARTLKDAMVNADVFIGLSVGKCLTKDIIANMAKSPIIFAMANPEPEVRPELVHEVRDDAIIATGRSDYPNQVNNALCFPYIFRGALDVNATHINDEMKLAAAHAIAKLGREEIPEEANTYADQTLKYGSGYIIPVPFDPRLIQIVAPAVAKAAMDSGVARRPIKDMAAYTQKLKSRLDPTYANLEIIFEKVRQNPRKVIFTEGEEEAAIRAAVYFHNQGLGDAILIGREKYVEECMKELNLTSPKGLTIHNAKFSEHNKQYIDFLYERLQRKGYLYRDCQRLVHQDRNIFGACMVHFGHADALVTGLTRNHANALDDVLKVINPQEGQCYFGLSIAVLNGRAVILSDTSVHAAPTPEILAKIAKQSAQQVKFLGSQPRVAFLSFSNFGNPDSIHTNKIREAVHLLDEENVDFEYDGDMSVDVALNMSSRKSYPFCRLSGPANILIMPDLHCASISAQLLQGQGSVIGPILIGLMKSVQIVPMNTSATEMTKIAAIAAYHALVLEERCSEKVGL